MTPAVGSGQEIRLAGVLSGSGADEGVAGFAARVLPLVERALSDAVAGLGAELGGVQGALDRAVGIGDAGGRRWRPLLACAAAEACGSTAVAALPAAVASELTHTASLVLDDLPCMDDAEERRGIASTHRRVGSAGAILVAMGLLGRAAELLATSPRGASALGGEWGLCFGMRGMSGGQAADLAGWRTGGARRLLRRKTTALSAFAVAAGGRAAGAGETTCDGLAAFGRGLGWAYQLADDAQDAAEDAAVGRACPGRAPLRQAGRLLRLSERRLVSTPGLSAEGVALLAALGATIVPTAAEMGR